jgi:hypothetical protein
MLGLLARIAISWLLIGVGGGILVALVKEPGLGGVVYVLWGIAVALSGGAAHLILVFVPTFRRSFALVQVLAISALALSLLLLYAATASPATTSSDLHFYVKVLPYSVPSLLVVATVVNELFTPSSNA